MKYKVGDRVKIKEHMCCSIIQRPWNGAVMTIDVAEHGRYLMKEDKHHFNWFEHEIECLAEENLDEQIVIYRKGAEIIAIHRKDKIIKNAKARCNPADKFNFRFGAQLAYNRLMYGEDNQPMPNSCIEEVTLKLSGDRYVIFKGDHLTTNAEVDDLRK